MILSACVVLVVLGAPNAATATIEQERILSYIVTGEVRADGTVAVTERIRYHFAEPRHGIFRFFPLYYPLRNPDGSVDRLDSRKIEVSDHSATMDGEAVPSVEDTGASGAATNFVLQVGDDDNEVTGDHDYRLKYRLHGLLNAPGGRPELFWDALGNESDIPVDHAEVTVTAPGPIGRVRLVVGGSDRGTAQVNSDSARFTTDRIGAHTAVTVTVALPDTVTVPPPTLRAARTFTARLVDNLLRPGREAGLPVPAAVVVTIIVFALGALLGVVFYRPWSRAPAEPPVARSEPPPGVPAALCGVVLRGRVDRSVAAAVLTDMAVRGLLSITEVPGGFQVAWTGGRKKIRHKVHAYERPIVSALSDPVTLTGNRNDSAEFSRALGYLPEELADLAVRLEWFTTTPPDPVNVRRAGIGITIFTAIAAFVAGLAGLVWWAVPFVLAGVVLYRRPYLALRGRTTLGSAVRTQVLGFQQYLRTVDLDRIGNDVRTVFDRYLPYTLALGLADQWIATFAAAGITPDRWYTNRVSGGSTGYLVFAGRVNSVSTSPISVGSATGSSSFTSTSGFSGSGSGGGGGGGVGSW